MLYQDARGGEWDQRQREDVRRGVDQHGVQLQPDMEECLSRDSELCTSSLFAVRLRRSLIRIPFHQFGERTPGSFIEERGASMVWRFWTGDTDHPDRQWAQRQAAEAQNHIFDR